MNNLPITSRIKRSPLLTQVSKAIDPDDPNKDGAKGYYKSTDPDTVTTEKVAVKGGLTGKKDKKQMSNAAWKKYLANETPEQKAKRNKREVDTGLREPDKLETKTTTTPGETEMGSVDIKEAQESDVFQPWETRQMSRGIKKEQRDIRRAKIKKAKKEGTLTGEMRKKFKAEENEKELEEFQAAAKRNKEARASGKRTGTSNVHGIDRNKSEGEDDEKTQVEKKRLEDELAEKNKTVTTPGPPANTPPATVDFIDPETRKPESEGQGNPLPMNPSAFKMYAKSPATKTLQGNQGKLPMQLQNAIKAAPGKMKSALKKGYFKNK